MMCRKTFYFDGHVHLQPRFAVDRFFAKALENFLSVAKTADRASEGVGFLLLTDSMGQESLSVLEQEIERQLLLDNAWQVHGTKERLSVVLERQDCPDFPLVVVAGQQVVTRQRLEILALGVRQRIADGCDIREAVEKVKELEGVAVLPWGFGKWFGGRGRIVREMVENLEADGFFLGDNGGRPLFWPTPRLFARGLSRSIRVLSGSDPLPLAKEEERVGSFGGMIEGDWDPDQPWGSLKQALLDPERRITPFGRLQSPLRFVRNQFGIRFGGNLL